ncbi:MAG: CopD family protein [Candidatus Binatia bacterium]
MLFLALVIIPIVRQPDLQSMRSALVHRVGVRFRAVGWAAIGVLLATGLVNLAARGVPPAALFDAATYSGRFGAVLAIKLALVAIVLALSYYHDFHLGPRAGEVARADPGGDEALRLRALAGRMGRAETLLVLVIVALGILLGRSYLLG